MTYDPSGVTYQVLWHRELKERGGHSLQLSQPNSLSSVQTVSLFIFILQTFSYFLLFLQLPCLFGPSGFFISLFLQKFLLSWSFSSTLPHLSFSDISSFCPVLHILLFFVLLFLFWFLVLPCMSYCHEFRNSVISFFGSNKSLPLFFSFWFFTSSLSSHFCKSSTERLTSSWKKLELCVVFHFGLLFLSLLYLKRFWYLKYLPGVPRCPECEYLG